MFYCNATNKHPSSTSIQALVISFIFRSSFVLNRFSNWFQSVSNWKSLKTFIQKQLFLPIHLAEMEFLILSSVRDEKAIYFVNLIRNSRFIFKSQRFASFIAWSIHFFAIRNISINFRSQFIRIINRCTIFHCIYFGVQFNWDWYQNEIDNKKCHHLFQTLQNWATERMHNAQE